MEGKKLTHRIKYQKEDKTFFSGEFPDYESAKYHLENMVASETVDSGTVIDATGKHIITIGKNYVFI
jgi:hypothetical protein